MKLLSWLVGVPFAAVVLLFALSNRQTVLLTLWPFEDGLPVPAYLAVLGPLLAGVLAGALFAGAAVLKHRRTARRQTKRADALDRQLKALQTESQAAAPSTGAPIPPPALGDLSKSS